MGGCNRGHSFADSNVQVHIENIKLSERYICMSRNSLHALENNSQLTILFITPHAK
jgi:hypothetical protein